MGNGGRWLSEDGEDGDGEARDERAGASAQSAAFSSVLFGQAPARPTALESSANSPASSIFSRLADQPGRENMFGQGPAATALFGPSRAGASFGGEPSAVRSSAATSHRGASTAGEMLSMRSVSQAGASLESSPAPAHGPGQVAAQRSSLFQPAVLNSAASGTSRPNVFGSGAFHSDRPPTGDPASRLPLGRSPSGMSGRHPSLGSTASASLTASLLGRSTRSRETERLSNASRGSGTVDGRSSFALERIDAGHLRPSLDMFGPAHDSAVLLKDAKSAAAAVETIRALPPDLQRCVRTFAACVPQSLMPVQVLAKAWRTDPSTARTAVERLAGKAILRYATLADSSVWCTLNSLFCVPLQHLFREDLPEVHAEVLSAYEGRRGFRGWEGVQDDGYIMLHVTHHLAALRRFPELRALLLSPVWLEQKMHWHGPTSVVKDFYASIRHDEAFIPTAKLLLQAFKMAEGTALAMPHAGTLRAQMVSRTAAVAAGRAIDPAFSVWWHEQVEKVKEDLTRAFDQVASQSAEPPQPLHLITMTPTLSQACGIVRLNLAGHTGPLVRALLTADMKEIVTASTDGTLRVWDVEVGVPVATLDAGAPIAELARGASGRVVTLTRSGTDATVWDLATQRPVVHLTGSPSPLSALLVHPKGSTALVGNEAGEVRMHRLADGLCELSVGGHAQRVSALAAAWQVTGAFEGPLAASGSRDGAIFVWDLLMVDSGEPPIARLAGHSGAISALEFYARGERLASASHDGSAALWDVATGRRIVRLSGHSGRLNTVAIEPRFERRAATSSDDGTAMVWRLDDGTPLATLGPVSSWIASAIFLPELDDALAPDDLLGRPLVATASGDGVVAIWDATSGERVRQLVGHSGDVATLEASARGRFLLTASGDRTSRLYDLLSQVADPPLPHDAAVQALLDLSPLERLVSFGHEGSLCLWNTASGELLRTASAPDAPRFVAASPDGARAAGCAGNRAVAVWDTATLAEVARMPAVAGSRVKCAAFSGDCMTVAIVLFDSTVTLWDVTRGEVVWQPQARAQRTGNAHTGGVNTCHLSADGALLATTSKDCTARLWDVPSKTLVSVLSGHTAAVTCAWLAADASLLLTGSEDCTCRVWDARRGGARLIMEHKRAPTHVVASPAKRSVLTCCNARSAWLWNLVAGTCTAVLRVRDDAAIQSGAFLPGGRLLVTRHDKASVGVWHVGSGALVAFFAADSAIHSVATGVAASIACGTQSGRVHHLSLPLPDANALSRTSRSAPGAAEQPVHVVKAKESNTRGRLHSRSSPA